MQLVVAEKLVIGANGCLPFRHNPLPLLVSAARAEPGAPSGVPPPVLPFMQLHKPHDTMNALVSPATPSGAPPPWRTFTSRMENMWQFCCFLATLLQLILGLNVAATNVCTLDVQLVVDAKPKTAGETA